LPAALINDSSTGTTSGSAAVLADASPENSGRSRPANWREFVARTVYRTGMLPVLRGISRRYQIRTSGRKRLFRVSRVPGSSFAILCYHRVGTEGIPYYCTLEPSVFEMQMRYLREHFRVVSLGQLCEEIRNPSGSGQAVAVTFDDGYSDLYTHALPILRKYQIPATIYLIADCVRTGEVAWYDKIFLALQIASGPTLTLPLLPGEFKLGSPEQRIATATQIVSILRRTPAALKNKICSALEAQFALPAEKLAGRMLSWTQIREMRAAGIDFGAHTLSHPVLSQLTDREVATELADSKRFLEEGLGEPVLDLAYPFGRPEDYGARTPAIAAQCGYRSAVTTTRGLNAPGADLHTLRRVQLGERESEASFGFHLHLEFLRGAGPPEQLADPGRSAQPLQAESHSGRGGQ